MLFAHPRHPHPPRRTLFFCLLEDWETEAGTHRQEVAELCNWSWGTGRGPGSGVAESQLPARGPEEHQTWRVSLERPGFPPQALLIFRNVDFLYI